jgi:hypothetical protein
MADPLTWAAIISAASAVEGGRKAHVGGKIAKKEQKAATEAAEKKARGQEAKNQMIRQEAAKNAKLVQTEAVTKSPFAGKKKKGSMRSQFTVGGGGSGTNY